MQLKVSLKKNKTTQMWPSCREPHAAEAKAVAYLVPYSQSSGWAPGEEGGNCLSDCGSQKNVGS